MSPPIHDLDLTALETRLAALAPAPVALDRDVLLFRAGQASVRNRQVWPCATGLATFAALVLAVVLLIRPAPLPIERVVTVPSPAPQVVVPPVQRSDGAPPVSPPVPSLSPRDSAPPLVSNYLTRRREVTRWGVDALPEWGPEPVDYKPEPFDTLFDLPPELVKDPWRLRREASLQPGGAL
jgi:hypothetical protein